MKKFALILSLLLTFGLNERFIGSLHAQTIINTDSLLRLAQQSAVQKNYDLARQQASRVLQISPDYTDAAILIGQSYAWEQKFDEARKSLIPLLDKPEAKIATLQALASVELWDNNPEKSLLYTNSALALDSKSIELLLIKAYALRELERYSEAKIVVSNAIKSHGEDQRFIDLSNALQKLTFQNSLSLDYQFTTFNQDTPDWHLSTLQYSRILSIGTLNTKINFAERFNNSGLQGEIDFWPRLTEKTYAYLNAGLSNSELFPSFRAGAEVYRILPFQMEASAGFRTLIYPGETVWLYTGHIGKYIQKYWIGFRPFLQQQQTEWNTTGTLQIKRYFRGSDEFISLFLSKGSTPLTQVALSEINRLDASKIGAEGQARLGTNFLIGTSIQFERESYAPAQKRNRFTTGLSLQYQF